MVLNCCANEKLHNLCVARMAVAGHQRFTGASRLRCPMCRQRLSDSVSLAIRGLVESFFASGEIDRPLARPDSLPDLVHADGSPADDVDDDEASESADTSGDESTYDGPLAAAEPVPLGDAPYEPAGLPVVDSPESPPPEDRGFSPPIDARADRPARAYVVRARDLARLDDTMTGAIVGLRAAIHDAGAAIDTIRAIVDGSPQVPRRRNESGSEP